MRRLVAVLPLCLVLLPAAAHGAAVQTDRTCYLQTDRTNVTVSGSGYTPGRPYGVTLDGTALSGGAGTIDANGAMQGAFAPPVLADDELERAFTVGVSSDALAASSVFTVTRLKANFTPSTGDPKKLKVRFSVAGFGLAMHNPDVYVHYVTPAGKLKKTLRIGQATGQCGRIVRTAKRRLFPFTVAKLGKWQLQFDTTKSFKKGLNDSNFLFYSIGVCLQPPGRAEAERDVALPTAGPLVLTQGAPSASTAVALRGATVRRWSASAGRELRLLDAVDWEVRGGEHWVVLGPNGAGKTTLMHLAGAMAQPSSGEVEVLGRRLGAVDVRALREGIGFVDARLARSLRGHLNGLQTVLTGAFNTIVLPLRRLTPEHEERARALMALVSAAELADRRFEDCSQGERQRLLLARALMADPALLLLDEPAAGLDLPGREGLVGALVSLARDRPALPTVTVTHHLEEISPSTTHALLLRGGRVLAGGPAAEVLTSERVSDCFGVTVDVSGRRGRWAAAVRHDEAA